MATPRTDASGQIQKAAPKQEQPQLLTLLNSLKSEIGRAVPKHLTGDRMARLVTTALRTVPDLVHCTPPSFAGCVMMLSQLGLEPNTPLGHSWLIPRRNNKANSTECTIIIGYQGFLELGRRAGVNAYAHVVRDGDEFSYSLGLKQTVNHIPSDDPDRESKPITYVYAVARTREFPEEPIFVVLSRAQVMARKKRSATAGKGFSPWQSDEEAMFLKTGIRALWKWMPKAIEHTHVEALEAAVDSGRSQISASILDPSVEQALAGRGLQLTAGDESDPDASLLDQPPDDYDSTTGEVHQ
jgi:recombination protein RecT